MMIRYCLLLIVLTGMFSGVRGQQHPEFDPRKAVPPEEFSRILVPPEEVEGQASLFQGWQRGTVFLSQGRFVSDVAFNYDMLHHRLLVLVEEKEYILNPIAVDSILISNSPQVLINPVILEGADMESLLLRVYDGAHLSLFRHTITTTVEEQEKTTSTTTLKYEYKKVPVELEKTYFLLNKTTSEFHEIQGKIKELKKWEHGEQLVDFVKNQQLDLKDESDLIKVVAFSNQLNVK